MGRCDDDPPLYARRVMPIAQARVCGLCGRAFTIVLPPDEAEPERDKLCPYCAQLPPPDGD